MKILSLNGSHKGTIIKIGGIVLTIVGTIVGISKINSVKKKGAILEPEFEEIKIEVDTHEEVWDQLKRAL